MGSIAQNKAIIAIEDWGIEWMPMDARQAAFSARVAVSLDGRLPQ